ADTRTGRAWRCRHGDDRARSGHGPAAFGTARRLRVHRRARHPETVQSPSRDLLSAHEPGHAARVRAVQARAEADGKSRRATRFRTPRFRQPVRRVVARGAELLHPTFAAATGAVPSALAGTRGRARPVAPAARLHANPGTR